MGVDIARRTQTERRRESELGLLRAAVEVIARQGVGAVTFEVLGRASGFSRGLVTQRFGSKQRLIEALLLHLHEDRQRALAAQGLEAMPGLEAVLAYVDQCLSQLAERLEARAYFTLLSSSVAEGSDLRSAFRRTHAEVEEQLGRWIRKGQAEGGIRGEVDPRSAALMIGCMLFGTSMQMLVDPQMDIAPVRDLSLIALKLSLGA
ncbi:MAG TPA: TetR/AcrR family transcriptional regulator [Sphingobium sp.]|uniref:TetR/AcrR family transcriptional regulator n=1 Tax=Sphingobium sp. TaxID=1912891 RepID=UPI002ED35DFF